MPSADRAPVFCAFVDVEREVGGDRISVGGRAGAAARRVSTRPAPLRAQGRGAVCIFIISALFFLNFFDR